MRAPSLAFTLSLALSFATVLGQDSDELVIEIIRSVECDRTTHNGDVISVNYNGTFTNGTLFDSSACAAPQSVKLFAAEHGTGYGEDSDGPFSFTLGAGKVIKGYPTSTLLRTGRILTVTCRFDQGLVDMCIGEQRCEPLWRQGSELNNN
jgi:FK506-binding protein 2